jgi:D-sedoheptulose 7-phosphate isomerase
MSSFDDYFNAVGTLPRLTECTHAIGLKIPLVLGIEHLTKSLKPDRRVFIIGNGASASIPSHCASHYKMGKGTKIMPLNDVSAMTMTANDFGYENVYAMQIEVHADEGDLLIAVSSSGKSPNIIKAAEVAKDKGCEIITFTGFESKNPLRKLGSLNFWVPSYSYGHVELTHMALLHAAFDLMETA